MGDRSAKVLVDLEESASAGFKPDGLEVQASRRGDATDREQDGLRQDLFTGIELDLGMR